jgi:Helix-turn-helix domain
MNLVPFTVKEANLRVISSEIGKVVPIYDIVQAIEIDKESLFEIIHSNNDLFEAFVVSVPVSSDQDNSHEAIQNVKALNHYGVISLVMILNQKNTLNAEKRSRVLRFQKWTINVLGGKVKTIKTKDNNVLELPHPDANIEFIKPKEAAEILGKSYKSVLRYIKAGKLKSYKMLNGQVLDKAEIILYRDLIRKIN